MPTSWRGVEVKCPFYVFDEKLRIQCEGVGSCRTVIMAFRTAAEKEKHLDAYCIRQYKVCPMCQAIMKKYGGEL